MAVLSLLCSVSYTGNVILRVYSVFNTRDASLLVVILTFLWLQGIGAIIHLCYNQDPLPSWEGAVITQGFSCSQSHGSAHCFCKCPTASSEHKEGKPFESSRILVCTGIHGKGQKSVQAFLKN